MSRMRIVGVLAVVLGMGLAVGVAQSASGGASASSPNSSIDAVYASGYSAGYPQGKQDQAAGVAANAHKFSVYQKGTPSFQSGYEDGYNDGFAGRAATVPLAAAGAEGFQPAENGAKGKGAVGAGVEPVARGNGYREGYNIGQSDANAAAAYDASGHQEYQMAQVGYQSALGSIADYQKAFQDGFTRGYDDGYRHRLYDTAIGARKGEGTAIESAAGSNPIPTDPERRAARPSGVYSNGILVAQGTEVQTTLDQQLDTKNSYAGQAFTLTVSVPVWVGGVAVIPAGSKIQGTVAKLERGGRFSGNAVMQLQYNTLTLPGQAPISLAVDTSGTGGANQSVDRGEGTIQGEQSHTGSNAAKGAAVGAAAGGIFGGGGGLIRGGAAGAAVGILGGMLSHDRDITLKKGSVVRVQLQRPLELPPVAGK